MSRRPAWYTSAAIVLSAAMLVLFLAAGNGQMGFGDVAAVLFGAI